MAVHARLKNEFMEVEKCQNLMGLLIFVKEGSVKWIFTDHLKITVIAFS